MFADESRPHAQIDLSPQLSVSRSSCADADRRAIEL
jgi:hypothetical protein